MSPFIKRFNLRIEKPTLFSVIGPLVIIGSIIRVIYLAIYENGGDLETLFFILLIMSTVGLMAFDRLFATFVDNKILSALELLFIACTYVLYLYNTRQIIIDLSKSNNPYVVIIDDTRGVPIQNFERSRLFNRTLKVHNRDLLIVNNTSFNGLTPTFQTATDKYPIMIIEHQKPRYKFNCIFVAVNTFTRSKKTIDSIIDAKGVEADRIMKTTR
jgi:hypothetical protein